MDLIIKWYELRICHLSRCKHLFISWETISASFAYKWHILCKTNCFTVLPGVYMYSCVHACVHVITYIMFFFFFCKFISGHNNIKRIFSAKVRRREEMRQKREFYINNRQTAYALQPPSNLLSFFFSQEKMCVHMMVLVIRSLVFAAWPRRDAQTLRSYLAGRALVW